MVFWDHGWSIPHYVEKYDGQSSRGGVNWTELLTLFENLESMNEYFY